MLFNKKKHLTDDAGKKENGVGKITNKILLLYFYEKYPTNAISGTI